MDPLGNYLKSENQKKMYTKNELVSEYIAFYGDCDARVVRQ